MNQLLPNCKHIIQMRMHTDNGGFDIPGWLDYRLVLFKELTLKSVLAQTNKDFIVWLRWHANMKDDESVLQWQKLIKSVGINSVFTFDDLSPLKEAIEATEWIYVSNCDTDDLIHSNYIDLIQTQKPILKKAVFPVQGYRWDIRINRLETHEWKSPPFWTIIFPTSVFFDEPAKKEYMNIVRGHQDIAKKMKAIILPGRLYVHVTHGLNAMNLYKKKKERQQLSDIDISKYPIPNIKTIGQRNLEILEPFGL